MTEKKPFVVLDLLCGGMPVLDGLAARGKFGVRRPLHYIGIDSNQQEGPGYEDHPAQRDAQMKKHAKLGQIDFHETELNFHEPEKLAEQLEEILKGRKVDEVYAIMHTVGKHLPNGATLKELSKFMNKGARLYVIEQEHVTQPNSILGSYLMASYVRGSQKPNQDAVKDEHEFMTKEIQSKIEPLGFTLERHGIRTDLNKWYATGANGRITRLDWAKLIHSHTKFQRFANNFAIVKKVN